MYIWSPTGTTGIGSEFGHQVTSLALLGFKFGNQVVSLALPHCRGMSYWHYQLVLGWYLHQPESHQLSLQKVSQFVRDKRIHRSDQGHLGPIKRSNEVVAIVGKEGPSPPSMFGQRGPKLLNGSSPASAGLIPRGHPQQSPSAAKMVPKTALKQVCKCTQSLRMIELDYSFSGGRREVGQQGGDKRGEII